jgi:hypothetical protein
MVMFSLLGFLFTAADDRLTSTVIEADASWRFDAGAAEEADVVVWGRAPLSSGAPLGLAVRSALARERALRRLTNRRHPPWGAAVVHRLPATRRRVEPMRDRVRDALFGGALVELGRRGTSDRVIDWVTAAAAGTAEVGSLRVGTGGSALIKLHLHDGTDAFLRLAPTGSRGDPSRTAEGLRRLKGLRLDELPLLLGSGITAGASWTVESIVPGQPAGLLTESLIDQAVSFCVRLGRGPGPPFAAIEHLVQVAATFPWWRDTVAAVMESMSMAARGLPSVPAHGDFWAGNLLIRNGQLTGVVDWDAWHPAGLPGTDLLHLIATDQRMRSHTGMGQAFHELPWRSSRFRTVLGPYWHALGVAPDRAILDAVGIAWWAGQVANTVLRLPHLAKDTRWVRENVDQVLTRLVP